MRSSLVSQEGGLKGLDYRGSASRLVYTTTEGTETGQYYLDEPKRHSRSCKLSETMDPNDENTKVLDNAIFMESIVKHLMHVVFEAELSKLIIKIKHVVSK